MQLAMEELDGGITKIILDGRMDIAGAESVDMKMNVLAGTKKFVLLDMQKVSFLGSMGLRTFFSMARTVKSRGGKMVFFGPDKLVEKVLTGSGLDALVPIHNEIQTAITALQ